MSAGKIGHGQGTGENHISGVRHASLSLSENPRRINIVGKGKLVDIIYLGFAAFDRSHSPETINEAW